MFNGEKLLVLGASTDEIPLVNRAKELGVYVIVTDYYTDHKVSPAKDIADEFWDISWSDLDTLEKKCIENNIKGITAGYSEIRVDNMIELCRRLNLPSYTKEEQLEVTRNKYLFKKECIKYGLPVIKAYENIEAVDSFPVIVKPVDRGGSIGVGIANNQEELIEVYKEAYDKSLIKKVIIEDYITNQTEMDLYFGIFDGEPHLISSDDIIQGKNNIDEGKVVQSVWLLPERHENKIIEKYNDKFVKMIKGWGLKSGTVFFSAFVDDNSNISIFECGYRLWGVQDFGYIDLKGYGNPLDIYIYYALTGKTNILKKKVNKKLKCVEINCYLKPGKIKSIKGFDKINQMNDCSLALLYSYEGQECHDGSILTKGAIVGFSNTSVDQLKKDVDFVYENLVFLDEKGNNMLYDKIDTGILINWWDK